MRKEGQVSSFTQVEVTFEIAPDTSAQGDRERAQLCETLNFCEKG